MSRRSRNESDRFRGTGKWMEYLAARACLGVLQRLPVSLAWRVGRGLGWVCWKLLKSRRTVVEKNLGIVNGWMEASGLQHPPSSTGNPVREVFMRSGANLLSGFTFSRMDERRAAERVEVVGYETFADALAEGRGVVVLLAHMGPWEALAHLPSLMAGKELQGRFAALYRPLNNAYLDAWYRSQREVLGTRLFSRQDGFHKLVDFLRNGGALGVLADQKMREGVKVPFFGRSVATSPIPGLLQRRTGAAVLGLSIESTGRTRWRVTIDRVDLSSLGDEPDRESFARVCNAEIERMLTRSPLDGFWFHKRF